MAGTLDRVRFYQILSGLQRAGQKMGVFVTSHTLVDGYVDAPYSYSEIIVCWLPPAVIGRRAFHSLAGVLFFNNWEYLDTTIADPFARYKSIQNRQPHANESGGFCQSETYKAKDLIAKNNWEGLLAILITTVGSVNPHGQYIPPGVAYCEGCRKDISRASITRCCGTYWCGRCTTKSAVSGLPICPRCRVEYEGMWITQQELDEGVVKCSSVGCKRLLRANEPRHSCCGARYCRDHRRDWTCHGCGQRNICQTHIVTRREYPFWLCQECNEKRKRKFSCANPNCASGGELMDADEKFFRHSRTNTGYTRLCKDCIRQRRGNHENSPTLVQLEQQLIEEADETETTTTGQEGETTHTNSSTNYYPVDSSATGIIISASASSG